MAITTVSLWWWSKTITQWPLMWKLLFHMKQEFLYVQGCVYSQAFQIFLTHFGPSDSCRCLFCPSQPFTLLFPLILAGAEGAKTASYQDIQSDFIIVDPFSVDRNLRERLQLPCSLLNVRRLTMYLINSNSLSDSFRQESRVSKESFTS